MITPDEMRAFALAMPGAEEKSHFGQADFRVKNKIFAGLSRDATTGNLKLSPEAQSIVLEAEPAVFSPAAGAWGRSGWTHVRLAQASPTSLQMLIEESWCLVAPKRMVETHRAARAAASRG